MHVRYVVVGVVILGLLGKVYSLLGFVFDCCIGTSSQFYITYGHAVLVWLIVETNIALKVYGENQYCNLCVSVATLQIWTFIES